MHVRSTDLDRNEHPRVVALHEHSERVRAALHGGFEVVRALNGFTVDAQDDVARLDAGSCAAAHLSIFARNPVFPLLQSRRFGVEPGAAQMYCLRV